jgi:hypothetical protein
MGLILAFGYFPEWNGTAENRLLQINENFMFNASHCQYAIKHKAFIYI